MRRVWPTSLLMIVQAAAPAFAAGGSASAPCDAVAAHVKTMAANPAIFETNPPFDAQALLAPLVSIPQSAPVNAEYAEVYTKAAPLLFPETREADDRPVLDIQHVEGGPWRAVALQGTAHCTFERFFTRNSDDTLSSIATPEAYGNLCWSSWRDVGIIAGKPALIEQEEQDHPLMGLDVEITPWSAAEWTKACRVSIRFNDAFRVAEQFCSDHQAVCSSAQSLAPKLAQALARVVDGKTLGDVSPPTPVEAKDFDARLASAKKAFETHDPGDAVLPTFGANPRTEFPYYGSTDAVVLVDVDGKTYIARVGIGALGWRDIGDYLVAIYSDDQNGLNPVASYVVQRRVSGLQSVETSVPHASTR